MKVFGLYSNHDAGASVSVAGKIVAALEEERPTRIKHCNPPPTPMPGKTIAWLREQGYKLEDADIIALAEPTSGPDNVAIVTSFLGLDKSHAAKVRRFDHHECHAACAYYWSGWDSCYSLAVDGGGSGWYGAIFKAENNKVTLIDGNPMWDRTSRINPGTFYLQMTALLGFRGLHDEGKVTSLASYGNAANVRDLFSDFVIEPFKVRLKSNEDTDALDLSSYLASRGLDLKKAVEDRQLRADLAAVTQQMFEEMIFADVEAFVPRGAKLALSGGCFGNVVINRKLMDYASEVWVCPSMNDGGESAAAALLGDPSTKPYRLQDVYLGYDVGSIDTRRIDPKHVAKLLSEGSVVGLCQGKLEYGPRALGNRAILSDPRRTDNAARINVRCGRSSYMPFCPTILAEYADEILEPDWKRAGHAAEFMTVAFKVSDTWKDGRLAAVLAHDKTCRAQVLREGTNHFYWSVVDEFRKLTGVPAVLCTSLNRHRQPIAMTVKDCVDDVILTGAVDALVTPEGIYRQTPEGIEVGQG